MAEREKEMLLRISATQLLGIKSDRAGACSKTVVTDLHVNGSGVDSPFTV
jgi:hypothetical protein